MITKHSITLHGHRTSFSLENVFFRELKEIARRRDIPIAQLIAEVDDQRTSGSNLSSALRVHVLECLQKAR